ncbi:unnamed protein product [Rotaria sp. Silwood1]|nr:unnamed protein product [Rotaria sp. Silwood1]
MPEIGSCTDITCDDEIKALYECHCCLRLVCLHHLIQHVEITKQNKQRLDNLRNELNTVITTFKEIVEEKLLIIARDQNLIEQAKKLLDIPNSSIDELQNIFEKINQTITLNLSETVLKVESSLIESRSCSCICKCNEKKVNSYVEECKNTKDDRYSMHINHNVIDTNLFKNIFDECPLTFDGAYGLTQTNHSIELCEHGNNRRIGLYYHFIYKHQLKKFYAQHLVRAVVNNRDPGTTKLFDENEGVIDHFYKVSCPFFNGRINSTQYSRQNVENVPCQRRSLPLRYDFEYVCEHYLPLIVDRIISFYLSDNDETPHLPELFLSHGYTLDQFKYLQSLSLYSISSINILNQIIFQCRHLRQLTHLYIIKCYFHCEEKDNRFLMNNIWNISKLIYCNLDCFHPDNNVFIASTIISESIKYLIMKNIKCDLNNLSYLLQCTPHLRQLYTTISCQLQNEELRNIFSSIISLKLIYLGSSDSMKYLFSESKKFILFDT